MKVTARKIVAVSVIAINVVLGYWFYSNFERIPVEVDVGYRGEARYNDFLALQRFFQKLGASAQFISHRQGFPDTDGTLVYLHGSDVVAGADDSETERWVRAGGHVIVSPRNLEPDGLLTLKQVTRVDEDPKSVVLSGPGEAGETLTVEFHRVLAYEKQAEAPVLEIASEHGFHVLSFQHGQGLITALSDYRFLLNESIAAHDNAAFAWRLTHLQRDGDIWFITGDAQPPVWRPLFSRGWPLLVSLLAGALGTLWLVSCRFGPMLPADTKQRPRLFEHIAASGAFFWRHGQRGLLLEAVRDSVLRTMEYRHPGWLAATDRDERVAGITGLSPERINAAFAADHLDERNAFTEAIATLETIRKRL